MWMANPAPCRAKTPPSARAPSLSRWGRQLLAGDSRWRSSPMVPAVQRGCSARWFWRWRSDGLQYTHQNLSMRPRHLRLSIDAMAAGAQVHSYAEGAQAVVIGLKALVLLAPGVSLFMRGAARRSVRVPVLLRV